MKKCISFLAGLLLAGQIFASDIYIKAELNTDYYKSKKSIEKTWKVAFQNIQEYGKTIGVNVVDYESLPIAKTYYYWGEERSEKDDLKDRIKTLKKQKKDYEKQQERYKSYGLVSIDGQTPEEELAEYDKKIAEAQEKLDNYDKTHVDPSTCRPYLEFKFTLAEGWDGDEYNISTNFLDKESNEISSINILPVDKSNTEMQTLMEKYVESFLPLAKESTLQKEPSIVDSKSLNISQSYYFDPVSIAPREDFSFVIREGSKITDFSSTWDEKSALNQKIAKLSDNTEWVLSKCGENYVLGNLTYPSVYLFDKNSILLGTTQYQFPQGTYFLRFFESGRPYVVDTYYNRCVYLPKKSGTPTKMDFPVSNTTGILAGPNETFWFCGDSAIFIYNTSGKLEKIIQIPTEDGRISKVLSDGSFVSLQGTVFSKYSSDGNLLWTKQLDDSFNGTSVSAASNGMYYLYTHSGKTLTRLVEDGTKLPPVLAAIMKSNSGSQNDSLIEKAKTYLAIADSYYGNGSYNSALENYNLYLQICPADASASDKKIMCEVAINKKSARELSEKALDLFDEYGEETAKGEYQKAMQLLEKLKKQVAWDEEVLDMYAELKNAFSTDGSFIQASKLSLAIQEVDLNCLFPALITVYASTPSGYIQVKNTSNNTLKNLSVSAYVRKYMDFSSQGEVVPQLTPGEDTYLSVSTILNKNVLNINEATPVQMQFTIKWEENGKTCSTTVTRPVTIYKKSALTWADTAMVACFVQPNDSAVSDFIFKALDSKMDSLLSTNMTKAIQISNAMGSIPLNYIADPVTPVTQVIDNEFAVDTVRFPSETLRLKGGDCDDMTTLFCSLMEGTGINSALITTEGHIFAAFDTGLPYNSIWENLGENYLVINVNGKAWIPIETTILAKGFDTAWKTASTEIGKEEFEVTTLSSAWEVYSSVPSDSSNVAITLDSAGIKKMNTSSRSSVMQNMTQAMAKVDLQKSTLTELNSMAKLYHSLGNDNKAIEVLSFATERDGTFRQGLMNLASLYEANGNKQRAKEYRQRANNLSASVTTTSQTNGRAANGNEMDWED